MELQMQKPRINLEDLVPSLFCPACGMKTLKSFESFGTFKCENCQNTIFMVPKTIFDQMIKKIDENHQKEIKELKGGKNGRK